VCRLTNFLKHNYVDKNFFGIDKIVKASIETHPECVPALRHSSINYMEVEMY